MLKKFAVLIILIMLTAGCSVKETGNTSDVPEKVKSGGVYVPTKVIQEDNEVKGITTFKVNQSFNQGGVITTINEILIYEDMENPGLSIIEFHINVSNDSDKDMYTAYDISPIILNTGEQVDDTDKCDINRIFKTAVKDGKLMYRVKTGIDEITSIRWVLISPMHNGSQIIGSDCDFTFVLTQYEKEQY